MRSQDGFQAANSWLDNPVNRRTFVRALGLGGLSVAAGRVLPLGTPVPALRPRQNTVA